MPILAHASDGNSFFKDSAWRGSPWSWRRVLDDYPNLRVCFGHFGHLKGIEGLSGTVNCIAWAEGFLDLIQNHPNVYADVSNTEAGHANDTERLNYQIRFLYWLCGRFSNTDAGRVMKLSQRLIYGSDWSKCNGQRERRDVLRSPAQHGRAGDGAGSLSDADAGSPDRLLSGLLRSRMPFGFWVSTTTRGTSAHRRKRCTIQPVLRPVCGTTGRPRWLDGRGVVAGQETGRALRTGARREEPMTKIRGRLKSSDQRLRPVSCMRMKRVSTASTVTVRPV